MISKTRFKGLSRCDSYATLENIVFTTVEELVEYEKDAKFMDLVEFLKEDEELGEKVQDLQMETLLPYYNLVEHLSARTISEKYGYKVQSSESSYDQIRFDIEVDDLAYYCFLDGYYEDENEKIIIETKATTSKKFLDLGYKEDGEHYSIFIYTPDGKLILREDVEDMSEDKKYQKCRARLLDKYNDCGKYAYDLAFQRYVVDKYHEGINREFKKQRYFLSVLNTEYVFDGKLDEEGNPDYGLNVMILIDFGKITEEYKEQIEREMKDVNQRIISLDQHKPIFGAHCEYKCITQCMFFKKCFQLPEKNSSLTYMGNHNGFKNDDGDKLTREDLLNNKMFNWDDVPYDYLNRINNQIQYNVLKNGIEYVNRDKIRRGIKELVYPLYHLDFESFPCPVPRYRGEKAYMQSLFQFSIHIERKPGICDKNKDHYEFLATDHQDRRLELVEAMIKYIPDDGGSVIVYNRGFEQSRLKELAIIFPEHKERLLDIRERCFDLLDIVKNSKKFYESLGYTGDEASSINYYHEDLQGSYSIKKVLPVFSDLTYKGMGVANGQEALVTYARFPIMEKEEFNRKKDELIEYCKQDTWAMVEILEKLRKI